MVYKKSVIFCALGMCLGLGTRDNQACTGLQVKATDGSIICARTMEFPIDIASDVIAIPKGLNYCGTTPDGADTGLHWTTNYRILGANAFNFPGVCVPHIIEGFNEMGLQCGGFYFQPSVSTTQAYQPWVTGDTNALASWEYCTWLLSSFETVIQVRAYYLLTPAALQVKVVGASVAEIGLVYPGNANFIPPLHFKVVDASGDCIVIEILAGDPIVHVYDEPLGVITNSPPFDWHITNLRNYVNLTATNIPPVNIGSINFQATGQGSGLLGLPGDNTPVSRFVRAVAFSQFSAPVNDAASAVTLAMNIISNINIPKGATRDLQANGAPVYEYTEWVSISDLANLRFYYRTYNYFDFRYVDLNAVDLSAGLIKRVPMADLSAQYENYSSKLDASCPVVPCF